MVLDAFSAPVREWFGTNFPEPTSAQVQGWPAILSGEHTLICAPTGSGKTLAAFLCCIDRLTSAAPPAGRTHRTRVLYLSPLRALAVDVEKNLRAPLAGIEMAAQRLGLEVHRPTVGMRTGDTPASERAALVRRPPDLLITTPESLYLMLTSAARDTLRGIDTVIVDEIHALAPTKRGAHLALSLERLEELCERPPQRIGLSATQRPLEEVARFLAGFDDAGAPRRVTIVDAGIRKALDLTVCVPMEDMGTIGQVDPEPRSGPAAAGPGRISIWPAIHPQILELVLAHRSTIIFTNARRMAERLAARLNELAQDAGHCGGEGQVAELVKAHHGSLAREQRLVIEDQLKRGQLRAIVATSSLELGIDMGAVDLVIQVSSPGAVSRGLQRVGRAGHQVGEPSKGTIFPKHRGDLLETAVVVDRMRRGLIEHTRYLRNPLDVLAQQLVAAVALDERPEAELLAMVRRCAGFHDLSEVVWASVLDLLAGRYPSEQFSELRPRVVWDRTSGTVRARDGSRRLAVTSGGTIPDRGLFGVFLPDGTRVGELDEEMVYESRPGETFVLGASTWRIEDITFERVVVTPAPGQPGKMPFWHGDGPGRPLELGEALGAFTREIRAMAPQAALERLTTDGCLDQWAAHNLLSFLDEQAAATGVVPDDRTIVVERFRDEIGDWRVCLLSPFGARVHAPWAMAVRARLEARAGVPVEVMWTDDGIVVRLPESLESIELTDLQIDPDEIEEAVVTALPGTSMFAARFRECAARALLLPRRRPDRRTPLWQQRQRSADLLAVAAHYPSFPILLETTRECLQDVFDVPALREVLGGLRSRRIRMVAAETTTASPFAQSLLFHWIATYMYEGDAPLAERRAAALSLDRSLLRELLGAEELRELIDPGVLADLELELQRLDGARPVLDSDGLHDLLRLLGPLSLDEIGLRCGAGIDAGALGDGLVAQRRAFPAMVAGEARLAIAEDAGRLRDGLGVAITIGLPAAFTESTPRPLEELVARHARTHGPFTTIDVARRLGAPLARVEASLNALEVEGRVVHGEFRPGGAGREWCDAEVLRILRRRCLAALRREIEPVEAEVLARFVPVWQSVRPPGRAAERVGSERASLEALVDVLGVLQSVALTASALDREVLAIRVPGYRPADLDALCSSGDVVWMGAGAIGSGDGRVRLFFREQFALLADPPDATGRDEMLSELGPTHKALVELLAARGSAFWPQLLAADPAATEPERLAALWDLVWVGIVTNDSLTPLRSLTQSGGRSTRSAAARPARARPGRLSRTGPASAAGRWSLVSDLVTGSPPAPTARRHALALQLLERQGVVTRESVNAEGVAGGFSAVYPVLKALEEQGRVRRGYFVAGLGAAQFALPGALDRLRSERADTDAEPLVLHATDPAQLFGAALSWPESAGRPARSATAIVVMRAGIPLVWFDRSSSHLITFPGAATERSWAPMLIAGAGSARGQVEVRKIDGEPAAASPHAAVLRASGFVDGYRGLVARRS